MDYFDALGKLRQERFHRPTKDPAEALEAVAQTLAQRGLGGNPRVRQKQGSNLTPMPQLQAHFMRVLHASGAEL